MYKQFAALDSIVIFILLSFHQTKSILPAHHLLYDHLSNIPPQPSRSLLIRRPTISSWHIEDGRMVAFVAKTDKYLHVIHEVIIHFRRPKKVIRVDRVSRYSAISCEQSSPIPKTVLD
jgi:hypothetical protein